MKIKRNAFIPGLSRTAIIGCVTAMLTFAAADVFAAEWRIEPRFGIAGEVDDNAVLNIVTVQEQEISGYVVDATARIQYSSPLTEFHFTPRFLYRDYGEPDFDSNDGFLRFGLERLFQSSRFEFSGNFSDEKARTAERADAADLELEDPDDIPDNDSGRVFVRDRRQSLTLSPEYVFETSEKSSLGISLRYIDVTYEDALAVLLNDYTDLRSRLTFRHAWSPRNAFILAGTYRTFESDCPTCTDAVSGFGGRIGIESRLSETMTLRALVGAETTELESGEDDTSPMAEISLLRNFETMTLFAQYQRSISGGGGGSLSARDQFNINFRRQLTDRIAAGLGVRAYKTDALESGVITVDERDYVQLRALFVWNLSETLALETHYRYTILDREVAGESANSNNVMVWLNWRPTPIVRSR